MVVDHHLIRLCRDGEQRKEKTLLYIFHVPFAYTRFFVCGFFPSPLSPFSHVSVRQTAVYRLCSSEVGRSRSTEALPKFIFCWCLSNFFDFCGLLGATYSPMWRQRSEWKTRAFRVWPSNFFSFCRNQSKHCSPAYSQNIWLSDLFCRRSWCILLVTG